MIMCDLRSGGLFGYVEVYHYSYIVRVFRESDMDNHVKPGPIYVMSFGNGVDAENRLLELLEHPAWTTLKHG
jgi:hypothetical protein